MITLVTIPISHYCEKARWALQRASIAFVEEGHVPLFSRLATGRRRAGTTTPVLVTPEGAVADSTAILRWVDERTPAERRLYPAAAPARREVEELEELFDERLGPHTRRVAYHHVLPDRRLTLGVLGRAGIPGYQLSAAALLFPVIRAFIRRGLRIDAAGVARSYARIDEVFADVGRRLSDGRRYLVGDRLSAADLTFAALAAPLLVPAEYGAALPAVEELPRPLRADRERLAATPAGAFALRLYAEERRAGPVA